MTDFLTSAQFGSGALAGVGAVANFVTGLVLMVTILFFFLKDGPPMWEFLLRPFRGDATLRAERIGDKTRDGPRLATCAAPRRSRSSTPSAS